MKKTNKNIIGGVPNRKIQHKHNISQYGNFQELRCQKSAFYVFRWEEQLLLK